MKRLLLLLTVASTLVGCMGDADWNGIADTLGTSKRVHPGDESVYQDPYPFSENEEAQMGPKAYDEQTRQMNAENKR